MSNEINGSCLCGQVTFKLTGPFQAFYLCYCSRCRRATGSAHASNIFGTPDQLEWLSGEEHIKHYDLPEAERFSKNFCGICGSALPMIGRDGTRLLIPAGTLASDPGIRSNANIFWAERAEWYDDALGAKRFDAYPE